MPSVGDFISVKFVQELSGVQLSNLVYFRVDDLGDTPTNVAGLTAVMNEYHSSVQAVLDDSWALVCGIYVNETGFEAKAITFTNLVGDGITDAHPQDQVVRLERYAVATAPITGTLRTAGFNQSGVSEGFSTRGRVNDTAEFNALRLFLSTQIIYGTGWTLTPYLKLREQKDPPHTFQFQRTSQCLLNTTFLKLRARKTNLCLA